ncbi:HGGxSTG domain-containing protein [Lysinibacillus fusiformis]|uniref:HGGxSTG domain-containing protein n=1 Tax=Lysinibacillus fusiformis TaxID=28031 RepID=UPI0016430204|nr:HGGxSTG domain-containing protein [Lysinibacillus fusiformis]
MRNSICGAIKKRTGEQCKNKPMKNGKCRFHGGLSTGPKDKEKKSEQMKGNKHAVKTHQYETLWADQFTGKHKDLFQLAPTDALEIVDMEIRKNEVRQMMIFDDIAKLKISGDKRKVDSITKMEEALTSVQNQKIRLLETKLKLLQSEGVTEDDENSPLVQFAEVFARARRLKEREEDLSQREAKLKE